MVENFRIISDGIEVGNIFSDYFSSVLEYMTTLTQITNTEVLAFIAALVFKLLSRKGLFINRKDNRNC